MSRRKSIAGVVVLILIMSSLACSMPWLTPTAVTLATMPTSTATPAAGISQTTATAPPPTALPVSATPTSVQATAAPTPVKQPTETEGFAGLSPAYDIYVGMNRTSAPCRWDLNAGEFSRLAWVSVFYGIRFAASPADRPGEPPVEQEIVEGEDESITEIADYAFCPTYEGDQVYECFLTVGPNPFRVQLSVDPDPGPDSLPLVPLAPTPDPLDQGPDLYLVYSVWGPDDGDIIIRAGDGHLGDCDGIGGPFMLPPPEILPVSWRRVMKGEEFIREFGQLYEDGTQVKWTVHFVPVNAR